MTQSPSHRPSPAQRWLTRLLVVLFFLAGAFSVAKLVSRSGRFAGDHFAYYTAAESLLAGKSPYEKVYPRSPYIYPPPFAYMAVPLAMLPPRIFGLFWGLLLGAGWLLSIRLGRRILAEEGHEVHWMADILPSLLFLRAGYSAWSLGNVTLILSPLILGSILLDRRVRTAGAGALLALAGMLKVFPLFVAAALFVRPGHRRGILALGGVLVVLAILPAFVVGVEGCISQWTDGFLQTAGSSLELQHLWKQRCAPLPTYWRLLGFPPGTALKVAEVAWGALCLLILCTTAERASEKGHMSLWYAAVVATLLIVTPIISKNYLVLLLYPCAAALQYALERPAGDRIRLWLLSGVGLSAFFLNIYNPWLVGSDLSRWMDRFQPAENCLLVFWLALTASLVMVCREKQPGGPISSAG